MQQSSIIILALIFWAQNVGAQFGPVFNYENGEYWGENRFDSTLGIKIPHGRGTYVSNDKEVKFHGEWKNGEPFHGTRYYKVCTSMMTVVEFHGESCKIQLTLTV